MSLEKAKAYLENKGFLDHVIELAGFHGNRCDGGGSTWGGAGHDRKDDVLFTGRAGGADSDGRNGESR